MELNIKIESHPGYKDCQEGDWLRKPRMTVSLDNTYISTLETDMCNGRRNSIRSYFNNEWHQLIEDWADEAKKLQELVQKVNQLVQYHNATGIFPKIPEAPKDGHQT